MLCVHGIRLLMLREFFENYGTLNSPSTTSTMQLQQMPLALQYPPMPSSSSRCGNGKRGPGAEGARSRGGRAHQTTMGSESLTQQNAESQEEEKKDVDR